MKNLFDKPYSSLLVLIMLFSVAFNLGLDAHAQSPDLRLFLKNGQNIVVSLVDEDNEPLEMFFYGYEDWEKDFDYYDENTFFVVIGEHRFLFRDVSHYRIDATNDIKPIYDTNIRKDSLKFEFKGDVLNIYSAKNSKFSIYNTYGVKLPPESYVGVDVVSIDLSNLPLGLYVISNGEQSLKFIKK